jgi:hypothetical protein
LLTKLSYHTPDDRTLQAFEAATCDAKRALWADKNAIPPWEWRKLQRGRSKK